MTTEYDSTPGDTDSGSQKKDLPYCRRGSPEEQLVYNDKPFKVLQG